MIPEWVEKYIGVPFEARGRHYSGVDCWGLVRMVLSEEFGKPLPCLASEYQEIDPRVTERLVSETRSMIDAARVEEPQAGDIVVMRISGHPCHVGIYCGHGIVLHVEAGKNAITHRVDSHYLKNRIEGYYHVG